MRCYNYPTFVSHGSGSWKLAAQDHGDVLGQVSLPGYVLTWSFFGACLFLLFYERSHGSSSIY